MTTIRSSLKDLILRGTAWTVAGQGASTLLRMARSLIMTRLLFPQAYGLMTLVWAVLTGLHMFADTGIVSTIIRDKRGDDPDFLNTAWTTNVIRGAVLSGITLLIARPMATFYHQPQLAYLIPVAGISSCIGGFASMAQYTCVRHMDLRRITLLQFSNDLMLSMVLVLWAFISPTVWAFVGGSLIGELYHTLATHIYLPGIRHKFRWERSSLHTIMGFGKWIYLSSAVYFVSTQSDRMLLGHYLSIDMLGVYGIAVMMSETLQTLVLKLISGVLFPAYSQIVQQESQRLRSAVSRARLALDVGIVVPISVLMIVGSRIVAVVYDARYHNAGWMLQVLCVRLLMVSTLSNSESCLVALGKPQYMLIHNFCRAVWILVGVPVGWSLMGIKGVVWVVALSEMPVIVVMWVGMARQRMFSFVSEFRSLLFVGLGVLMGLGILRLLP